MRDLESQWSRTTSYFQWIMGYFGVQRPIVWLLQGSDLLEAHIYGLGTTPLFQLAGCLVRPHRASWAPRREKARLEAAEAGSTICQKRWQFRRRGTFRVP